MSPKSLHSRVSSLCLCLPYRGCNPSSPKAKGHVPSLHGWSLGTALCGLRLEQLNVLIFPVLSVWDTQSNRVLTGTLNKPGWGREDTKAFDPGAEGWQKRVTGEAVTVQQGDLRQWDGTCDRQVTAGASSDTAGPMPSFCPQWQLGGTPPSRFSWPSPVPSLPHT